MTHWTPEQDASLTALISLSASEAALCLSRVLGRRLTRNAIIGRRHRLKSPGKFRPAPPPHDPAHPHARTSEEKQRRREMYAARKLGLELPPRPRRKWTQEERETRDANRSTRLEQRIANGLKTFGPVAVPPTLAPINGHNGHLPPRLHEARHAPPVAQPAYAGDPKLITELPNGKGCRFAVTDDRPFKFCGAPGYPWCEHHKAIVWRPV